jgi:hypothetical protein
MATCVSSILPFSGTGDSLSGAEGLALGGCGSGAPANSRRARTRLRPCPARGHVATTAVGRRDRSTGWVCCMATGFNRSGTSSGADGVVAGDGEAHEFGHFGHGGVDEFQVPGGELPVVGCVGSFEVAFGAVEQC